jgi:hypothetical protein
MIVNGVRSDIDIVLTTIARMVTSSKHASYPDYYALIKNLRERGGRPIDPMRLSLLCETCVAEGWVDEMEWKILNRMKPTEKLWARWYG